MGNTRTRIVLLSAAFALFASALPAQAVAAPIPVVLKADDAPEGRGEPVKAGRDRLFAIERTSRQVVHFEGKEHGPFHKTIVSHGLTQPTGLSVDSDGNAYVIDGKSLVRISRDGHQRNIAANIADPVAITLDRRGNLYVSDGFRVIRIWEPSGKQQIVGTVPTGAIRFIGTDRYGRPTALLDDGTDFMLATFSADGTSTYIRDLHQYTSTVQMAEGGDGTVYFEYHSGGGSGTSSVVRVAPNSSILGGVNTKFADYAWTLDNRDRLHLMQNRVWCYDPEFNTCPGRYDSAVDEVLTFPASGGTPRSTPASGLSLPHGGIAVGRSGSVYEAENDTATPQLVRIAPDGGAAGRIALGSFDNLTIEPTKASAGEDG